MAQSHNTLPIDWHITLTGQENAPETSEQPQDTLYLFTTKTCPNCRLAKEFLKHESYKTVDAEEDISLTNTYGVMQAPTLIVIRNGEVEKYVNASNIRQFVESRR